MTKGSKKGEVFGATSIRPRELSTYAHELVRSERRLTGGRKREGAHHKIPGVGWPLRLHDVGYGCLRTIGMPKGQGATY